MSSTNSAAIVLLAVIYLATTVFCRPGIMQNEQNEVSVENIRTKRTVDDDLMDKAFAYYKQLHADHTCKMPQQRILSVQQFYPTNAVSYTTDSVLLQRCAEDTGCCPPTQVCVAKDTKKVDIPILITKSGDENTHAQIMSFVDHTECHCVSESTLAKP